MARGTDASGVPRSWQLTPEWLTPIIARRYPGARVSRVGLLEDSDGTSSRARFQVEYSEGSGPATIFAKTQGDWGHRLLHWMTGNLYREALLYGSGVTLPVEHPQPLHGAVDRLRLNEVVVMEDLSHRGFTPNDATKPLSVEAVSNGLRELAKLHSTFWRFSAREVPELGWLEPWKVTWTFQLTLRRTCGVGISKLRDRLPAEVAALGARGMERWWTRYVRTVGRGPLTLLHGDPHVGNSYLLPGGELGFLDWACVRLGNWAFDVGYFLVSALDVAERRAHEADLIESHRRALEVPEPDRPSSEEAWLRYRSSTAYGLAVWLATSSNFDYQRREICSNLVERFGAAFVDLDTRAAVESLERA